MSDVVVAAVKYEATRSDDVRRRTLNECRELPTSHRSKCHARSSIEHEIEDITLNRIVVRDSKQ